MCVCVRDYVRLHRNTCLHRPELYSMISSLRFMNPFQCLSFDLNLNKNEWVKHKIKWKRLTSFLRAIGRLNCLNSLITNATKLIQFSIYVANVTRSWFKQMEKFEWIPCRRSINPWNFYFCIDNVINCIECPFIYYFFFNENSVNVWLWATAMA